MKVCMGSFVQFWAKTFWISALKTGEHCFLKPETTEDFQSFTDISPKQCIYLHMQLVPVSDNTYLEKKIIIIYSFGSTMWGATVTYGTVWLMFFKMKIAVQVQT